MKKYIITCRENLDPIEEANTYDEALGIVESFEDEDREDGNYTPNFYEIDEVFIPNWYQEKMYIRRTNLTVFNAHHVDIDFDVAVSLMDDELREEIHNNIAPCSDQDFFEAYEKAHQEKFGEEWELSKANPCY